jgi:hypothetical protein
MPEGLTMNARPKPSGLRKVRYGFLVWGWAMLLVILLSAAPTGAQSRTRLVGSAFDLATTSVVVSPKRPKAAISVKRTDDGNGPETPVGITAWIGVWGHGFILSPAAEDLLPLLAREQGIGAPRPYTRAHGPRAPPAG